MQGRFEIPPGAGELKASGVRQLHVVIHGLISMRLSASERTLTLYIPDVVMKQMGHFYLGGDYANPHFLPRSENLRLDCVQPGNLNVDPGKIQRAFAAASVATIAGDTGSQFYPRNVFAKIRLPWPDRVDRLRMIKGTRKTPLFTYKDHTRAIQPKTCAYLTYFSYTLREQDRPVLYDGEQVFWYSEALARHTRLHFFAGPPVPMDDKMYAQHVEGAYRQTGDQLFDPALDLAAEKPRPKWQKPDARSKDVPAEEQKDITGPARKGEKILSDVGNCLGLIFLD